MVWWEKMMIGNNMKKMTIVFIMSVFALLPTFAQEIEHYEIQGAKLGRKIAKQVDTYRYFNRNTNKVWY